MKQKYLGVTLIITALLGAVSLWLLETRGIRNKPITSSTIFNSKKLRLNSVWKNDIQRLIEAKEIPKAWSMIKKVELIPTDPLSSKLSHQLKPPIVINKDGIYRLEISIISHKSEKEKTQIVLQHNIIEIENENMIWELSRTYNLK